MNRGGESTRILFVKRSTQHTSGKGSDELYQLGEYTALPNSAISDITLVAWNWQWWEYLHRGKHYKSGCHFFFFLTDLIVNHLGLLKKSTEHNTRQRFYKSANSLEGWLVSNHTFKCRVMFKEMMVLNVKEWRIRWENLFLPLEKHPHREVILELCINVVP